MVRTRDWKVAEKAYMPCAGSVVLLLKNNNAHPEDLTVAHIFILEIALTKPYNAGLARIKPFRNPVRNPSSIKLN
jgi:hypothetical protein